MVKKKLSILLGLFFSIQLHAQKTGSPLPSTKEKMDIRDSKNQVFERKKALISIIEKQQTDWNRGDLKSFLSAYWNSDTLITVSSRGILYGKEKLERQLIKNYPDSASMGHLEYDVVNVSFIGENDALLTGKWLRKNEKKFRGGYFSILLKKWNNRWMIVSEHLG